MNRHLLWLSGVALLVHALLLMWAARSHSPTVQEPAHVASGLTHWTTGRFAAYRVNPPLVRLAASLPALASGTELDLLLCNQPGVVRPEHALGDQWVRSHPSRACWLVTAGRWACIPFMLFGAWACWRWASELYGAWSGLIALLLWCFSPNVLGHGWQLNPDAAAGALAVGASWAFWRWLNRPEAARAVVTGALLGLANLSKLTWIILFAVWPAVWVVWRAARTKAGIESRPWPRELGHLVLISLVGLFVINSGYGFEGTFQKLGKYRFVSSALGGPVEERQDEYATANRFAGTWLGRLPVPLPREYLLGIDLQRTDFERRMPSYLRGQWRWGGWWYYYLYAMAVKMPLGTWVLAAAAVAVSCSDRRYSGTWRDELALLAPALALIGLVSSQTGFNHHMRYVLPAFPFLFIWISKVGRAVEFGKRPLVVIAATGMVWSMGSSLWIYPHSLSYFNELVGGPRNGHAHLLDSNIDWGQDLLYLKRWLDQHPEASPLGLAYFGLFHPRITGIQFALPPKGPAGGAAAAEGKASTEKLGPKPGWYAVSVNFLRGFRFSAPDGQGDGEWLGKPYYTYFQRFRPVATAGYSIYIYHITLEEANRVRRELGLPELAERGAGRGESQEQG
ncbi:MAG TPA: hypothetical protein EYP56_03200, partial [Planctomycetaceae bacterium]|nr:hypothetical protein [Planctomycetaceae bacterium]